jgi:hypothetical protein
MPRIEAAPDLARRLAPVELPEAGTRGATRRLGTLWDQRPLLLLHLRHFG